MASMTALTSSLTSSLKTRLSTTRDYAAHELRVASDSGVRYWLAWKLAQLSYRACDTTTYAIVGVDHPDGSKSTVLVTGDAWGSGVSAGANAEFVSFDEITSLDELAELEEKSTAYDDANPADPDSGRAYVAVFDNITDFDVALELMSHE